MNIPRPEYPRPQFRRPTWLNLNGPWQFEIDHGASGRARGLIEKDPLDQTIQVPFCPESQLSGIGYKDFMAAVWYRRTFTLPEEALEGRVLLHFGAVDYQAEAWVNGKSVGVHSGGYASFTFDITEAAVAGENTLVVCADDKQREGRQPFGKQSDRYKSYACSYTRTTGIWQTVWVEWVPDTYMQSFRLTPDAENGTVLVDVQLNKPIKNAWLTAIATFENALQGVKTAFIDDDKVQLLLSVEDKHLWGPGHPALYDLKLELSAEGKTVDAVDSYFALRSVCFRGKTFLLNGEPLFQRLILDQGFYPDGIYTAPSDDALVHDIEMSMAMGFNGARLHQKVFEQRFLYHADRLGYICWGEMPSWGIDPARPQTLGIFLREWLEVMERDYSAPSIIGWCPFNEVWGESNCGQRDLTLQVTYRATKAVDKTRPVIDTSGGWHTETDIFDTHDYEQSVEIFKERYAPGAPLYDRFESHQHYDGVKPMFVSEYGGIRWTNDVYGWGYGIGPKTEEEFIERYRGLTTALLNNPEHCGFCYTQLTDVEQEQNGLYTYERVAKFPPEIIREINMQKAACEK